MENTQEVHTEKVILPERKAEGTPLKAGPDSIAPENQALLPLLLEQKAHNQKMERLMKLAAGCLIGILVLALLTAVLILPRALAILSDAQQITSQVQQMADQAGEILTEAQEVVTQVKEGDPKRLMDNLNSLAQEGEAAMLECVEQVKRAVDILDKMDIESLNTAVDNLGKAVAPMAKLFGGR